MRISAIFFVTQLLALSQEQVAVRPTMLARLSGSDADYTTALATGRDGSIYAVGVAWSPDFPVVNAAQPFMSAPSLVVQTTAGGTWSNLPNAIPFLQRIVPHPGDPQILFAISRAGIYKTADAGRTWRSVFPITPSPYLGNRSSIELVVDPSQPLNVIARIDRYDGLRAIRSRDGGESWLEFQPPDSAYHPIVGPWIAVDRASNWYFGSYRSTDAGEHWAAIPSPSKVPCTLIPDPWRPNRLYALSEYYEWVSDDRGATWPIKSTATLGGLAFDPDLEGVVYGLDITSPLLVASDPKLTWQQVTRNGPAQVSIVSRNCPGGGGMYGSTGNFSPDFGVTWQPAGAGTVFATGPGCATYSVETLVSDSFVAKVTPEGRVEWATFGGPQTGIALAAVVDDGGNFYVLGPTNTASPSVPGVFVSKFDTNGNLRYATRLNIDLTRLAVNDKGEAFAAGRGPGDDGVVIKLSNDGVVLGSIALPGFSAVRTKRPYEFSAPGRARVGVAVESSGNVLVGGTNGMMGRLSPDLSSFKILAGRQPGEISAISVGPDGDVFIGGIYEGPGTHSGMCFAQYVPIPEQTGYWIAMYSYPADPYVAKLAKDSLDPIFWRHYGGTCASGVGQLVTGPQGEVLATTGMHGALPFLNPYSHLGAFTFRLDANGDLSFASGLETGAVSAGTGNVVYGIWKGSLSAMPVLTRAVTIHGADNALAPGPLGLGSLYRINGEGFTEEWIDLGLNYPNELPTTLGGVRVLLNGVAAEIMQVAPDHVICVIPASLSGVVEVQVESASNGVSNVFLTSVSAYKSIELLTPDFPERSSALPLVRNADGSINDAEHPATDRYVTVYATGWSPGQWAYVQLEPTPPPAQPGSVIYVRFNPNSPPYEDAPIEHMPGFVSVLGAMNLPIYQRGPFFWLLVESTYVKIYVK